MMKSIYQFDQDDAWRFAREQGIKTKKVGNELRFARCPYCRAKTNDKDTFAINLDTGQYKCLRASCGAHGNMITLARNFNFSLGRDVDEYFQSSRRYRDLSKYPIPTTKPAAVAYLESRGISREVTESYSLTVNNEDDHVLVFPFVDEAGTMAFVKYRKTDFDKTKDRNKEWCEKDCKPILFGMDHCDPGKSKTLILTEGQIDSLSVVEAFGGAVNAVSVPNGAKGFTWVPHCWDFLCKFDELIVFGDYENDNISLLEEMRSRFPGTVKHVRPEDYKDCKDANDILRKYGKEAVRAAVENAVPVTDVKIKEVADIKRKSTADMERIRSGFREVDRILGGFYFGQLIILTGERGFGKSTLASQLMTRALDQGYSVFAYSGELVDFMFQEWVERQIAGDDYINPQRSSITGYCTYRINAEAVKQIEEWYRGRFYVYDNAAITEEPEELPETVRKAFMQYGCRVIFIDNLMTAMEDDIASDIYRQQARFVKTLAEMAKHYNILIFLIAHPRKAQGYNGFRNDDVAGSSNITNLADVVMNYTKPKEDKDHADPDCDRVLHITKNRLGGRLTPKDGIKMWYQESSKRITDERDKFDWTLGWDAGDFVPVEEDDNFQLPFGDE